MIKVRLLLAGLVLTSANALASEPAGAPSKEPAAEQANAETCQSYLSKLKEEWNVTPGGIEYRLDLAKRRRVQYVIQELLPIQESVSNRKTEVEQQILAAQNLFNDDFTLVQRWNPFASGRQLVQVELNNLKSRSKDLRYYDTYLKALNSFLTRQPSQAFADYTKFDRSWSYPRFMRSPKREEKPQPKRRSSGGGSNSDSDSDWDNSIANPGNPNSPFNPVNPLNQNSPINPINMLKND